MTSNLSIYQFVAKLEYCAQIYQALLPPFSQLTEPDILIGFLNSIAIIFKWYPKPEPFGIQNTLDYLNT